MNKKLASLIIKISANGAEAEAELRKLEKSVGDAGKRMQGLGESISKYVTAPLTALAGLSVAAANTQLQAEARLLNALRGREDVQRRLMSSASELASRSTLSDQAIISQQAFLAALGLTEDQITSTIEAAVQLSYATGMELDGAVKNLAKTYSGLTGELGESIPALKQFTAEELKAGQAVAYVNENYRGFAEKAASTGSGSLEQLKNQFIDLGEQLGMVLLPTLQKLTEWLSEVATWLQGLSPETMKWVAGIGAAAAALGPLLMVTGKLVASFKALGAVMIGTPFGAIAAGVLTIASALLSVKNRAEETARALREARKAGAEQRATEAYDTAMRQYNRPSVSDAELELAIKDWERMRDEEAAAYIAQSGGQMTQQQRDGMIVYNETLKALKNILIERARLKEDEQAILFTQQQQNELTDAELLAKMRLQRAESERLATLNAILDKEEQIARAKADYEANYGKDQGIDTSGVNLDSLTTMTMDLQNVDTGLVGMKIHELRQEFSNAEGEVEEIALTAISIGDTLANAFSSLATAIGEGLGNMLAGEEFNFGKTLFSVLGQALKEIGKQIISASTVVESIKKTLNAAGLGWAAIPVGMAAVALGQLLVAKAQQPIKLATGGLAYAPTLAVVGDNPGASSDPEVVAPLSKLRDYIGGQRLELVGNVAFELHGDTARAILNRENLRLSRLG